MASSSNSGFRPSDVNLPIGTVSLLFTDVEGSTRLLDSLGAGFAEVMEEHRDILRSTVERHRGIVFGTEGDAVFAVFVAASDAVAAAEEAQRRLTAHPWPGGAPLRVRMAVHTGDVRLSGDTYYGMSLHETARVCSAGHGGQVLLTGSTRDAVPACSVRDLGEHRLKDLLDAVSIGQLLADGLEGTFPPLRTLSAMPNNLPAGIDQFVGRAVELAAIVTGLTTHRLVTLTGAGGSGKTRLSLEAAGSLLGSVRDGAWVVELAPVSDPALITSQVAVALGLGESAGKPLQETLTEWLRTHDVLLVLDNCEHLIAGVAELADSLLRACPTLLILATSREVIGISGELVLRVPPLGLDGDAAELFLTRAASVVPGFERDVVDQQLVNHLCRRLDGLPLAIELAAARLRALPLHELAARLDDRFQLLTLGSRTAPTRQRTLEAVVDWSYDLLTEPERELFRAVSVFPDSFTFSAAVGITSRSDVEVIDGLGRLVEKSLVVPVESRSGTERFQLLETLRQYGRDRLRDNGEADSYRDLLLAWAMTYVDRLERDMWTPGMDAALASVSPERANMRAAMDWAIERDELAAALRLVTTVPLGLTTERRVLIADLLDRGGPLLPVDVVARAQLTLGDLAFEQGDWAATAAGGAAARAGFARLGDRRRAAWATQVYSSGSWGDGDVDTLDRLLAELLVEFRELGDDFGIAQTVWCISLREPDRAVATAMAVDAERRFRDLGSPIMRAHALEARALIEIEAGDLAAAAPFLREAVETLAGSGNMGCTAHTLEAAAAWCARRGDASTAGELIGAAESLRATSGAGHKPWEVRARYGDAYDADVLGDPSAVHESITRGRLHSLDSAAALVGTLLAASSNGN
jgi:predicted ATPase/class 3 adenylate cyclase